MASTPIAGLAVPAVVGHRPYMVSSRFARRHVVVTGTRLLPYIRPVVGVVVAPGLDESRAYRPLRPIGIKCHRPVQVFDTPV